MNLHGLLLVDKPEGLTSHDVVARLRKVLGQKRIGHTGTLDPIATGLMIMVLGEATKLSDYLVSEDKSYRVTLRLGVKTDTLDRSGKVLTTRPVTVGEQELKAAIHELQGEFSWPVPVFSAAKVGGRPLHELARQDIPVEPPVKTMKFWGVRLESMTGETAVVEISCSKGSFIRTWVDQLGERLGTGAIVEELRRSRVGSWSLEQSLSLKDIENWANEAGSSHQDGFISLNAALDGYRSVIVDEKEARLIRNGQIARSLASRLIPEQKRAFSSQEPVFIKILSGAGDLLSIVAAESGQGLKIRRVFQLS